MEPLAGGGGLWVGRQHPPLARGGSPLKRDLADKEHPDGPQKVISRPRRRPLARLPQWGRFVLGPCNPFLGTAPQRRPRRGPGPGRPPGVSAGRRASTSTPSPHTRCWSPGPSPRAGAAIPWDGEGRCGRSGGFFPFRKWRSLATTSGLLDFPSSWEGGTWAGKDRRRGEGVPGPPRVMWHLHDSQQCRPSL